LQYFTTYKFDLPTLNSINNSQDRLRLKNDTGLGLVVERALNRAGVKVNDHASNLTAATRDDSLNATRGITG
jgi:hypothetical protein